ncbi:N-carbamoyl-L-amino acid hydrolase [Emericellopsis cladophorae]|uniref:N-carbamoyl-L-amino acid hydrolase n=1 Tax=Emericellopsis cladophorae TaxID=2686198 RepID=A0A9P9YAF5_9HYPO|nr:N-carbamoyl-L-amino acid hydrolase [Emericellopsis cladophorae]KAI6786008.1 N-carbamoyl-L-amino acid hydrolase [Emericellopsis cladophorae]
MAVSSGVWAGAVPLQTAWDLREFLAKNGAPKSMEELDRIGYCGDHKASYKSNPLLGTTAAIPICGCLRA